VLWSEGSESLSPRCQGRSGSAVARRATLDTGLPFLVSLRPMADIVWSAYALAMFTEEQRAAAAGAVDTYVPPDPPSRPIPTPPPPAPNTIAVIVDGLNPNIPAQLNELYRRGWRFENGRWFQLAPGAQGTSTIPPGDPVGGRVGYASVPSQAVIQGGSVLGYSVPVAPAVLLPSFVGGRLGRVEIAGGMRPESGGQERVIIGGNNAAARMPEVRF